jgi:hypothetical protein
VNNSLGFLPENLALTGWANVDLHFNYYDDTLTRNDYQETDGDPNVWHFASFVVDAAGEGATYQDGMLVQSFSTSRTVPPDCRFSVGQEWDTATPSDFGKGFIDELAVYSEARALAAITAEQASGVDPTDPALAGYYTFENQLVDDSGHGHAGVLQAPASIVPTPSI